KGIQGAANFRQHAAIDGAIGDQLVDLGGAQAGDHVALLVHQAGDVGEQHQFLGLQRFGRLAGNKIGIDVVGLAILAHTDGGDDRDEIVGNQPVDQVDVDLGDFTHVADVDDLRLVHARGT